MEFAGFALRDWAAVAASKSGHWARQKETHGPGQAIRAAEALLLHVKAIRSDWPTEEDRREDLATHARVGACLRLVVSSPAH